MKYNTHELAWAAGFFDGEGYTGAIPYTEGRRYGLRIELAQRDDNVEVLERFNFATGRLLTLRHTRKGAFTLTSNKNSTVQAIMYMLWKYLSTAKREQFYKAMKTVLNAPKRPKLIHGQSSTLYTYYGCRCNLCKERNARKSRERKWDV